VRKGILFSTTLHVGIIGATLVAWPHAIPEAPSELLPAIPVELVTVADVSNVARTVVEEPPPPPAEEAPPPPEQVAEAPPEPEPPSEPEPAPEPEPQPEAPPPPKPAPEREAAATPPRNPVVPRRRPQPAPRPPEFNVDNVLALLDQRAPRPQPPPASTRVEEFASRGLGAQNAFTLDIRDALLAQMRECWNVPVGAPNPEQLVVEVRVFLARDGDLAQAPLLMPQSRAAAARNSYVNAAAQAALRAVNVCAPYRGLPVDRYDAWREIVMTFDPSKMMGR
jgi:outer membrane biosynthesis protein TonB